MEYQYNNTIQYSIVQYSTVQYSTVQYEHASSLKVTAPLAALIVQQSPTYSTETITNQSLAKSEVRQMRRDQLNATAEELMPELSAQQKRAMELGKEKGASSWLNALPIEDHGFVLHKGDFRDTLCLRYGWQPTNLPSRCACDAPFTVEHALSCPTGGFPTLRHNEVRDFTANIMTEVCHDVCTEPQLQELSGETLHLATSIRDDGAHVDIRAQGFWGDRSRRSFFDVRVFNPNAPSNRKLQLNSVYRRHEKEKRRSYEQRIREVEHGSFTPLMFSTSGGMGDLAATAYKRLASLLSSKHEQPYSTVMTWLRCHLSFSLLRSAVRCLRGARSSIGHAARGAPAVDLAVYEGHVPPP